MSDGGDISAFFAGGDETYGGAVHGGGIFGILGAIGATPILVLRIMLAIMGAIIFSSSKKAHTTGGIFAGIGVMLCFGAFSIMKKGVGAKS